MHKAHMKKDTESEFSGEFMTIREVAEILKVKPLAVYRYIRKGRLPAYRFGGQKKTIRIKRLDFEIFKATSLIRF
jgi:excisionase family DNA binding protein